MTEKPTDAAPDGSGSSAHGAGAGRQQAYRALALIRSGRDPEGGFRLLFECYHRPLLRFFARKGMAPADAADLTQETFLGIYRGLKDLRRESRLEAWLYRIATTSYLKRLRSRSAARRAGVEVPHDEIAMTHEAARQPAGQLEEILTEEQRRQVRLAIRELPHQMCRCLTLRIYQERSYREIAALLQIKVDTVKAHLFQARARLKRQVSARSLRLLDDSNGSASR